MRTARSRATGIGDPAYRTRRDEIDSVRIDFNHPGVVLVQPCDHFLQQIAPDLRHARGRIEIGKMSLSESQIAVETVDQNLEGILERLEVMPLLAIFFSFRQLHLSFRFETKRPEVGQQVTKNLELVRCWETIELQHHRRIERGDIAMPDVACDAGEIDGSESTLKTAGHRQLGDGMALPQVFAEKKRVDAGSVTTHDHVLVVIRENLRLDEIARAE